MTDINCHHCGHGKADHPAKVQGLHSLVYNIELRDIFAALAMAGFCSNSTDDTTTKMTNITHPKIAYFIADAMLEAREATRTK